MVLKFDTMKLQPGKTQQVFSTCTLKELCPEDKQKVAKLVKQVVELGQDNQRLKDAAEQATTAAEEKVKQIQECNKQAVKENCSLKTKLGQAVTVLRMYHHKVQGLDAALRAMQNAAAADAVQGTQPDTEEQHQQHAQQMQERQKQAAELGAAEVPAGSAGTGGGSSSNAVQQQHQQHSPGSSSSSPAQLSAEHSGMSASAAAERLQQQARQLSDLLAQGDLPPAAAAAAANSGRHTADESPPPTDTSQQQQQQQQQQQGVTVLTSEHAGREPLEPVGPLVLSPHLAGVSGALQDLAAWQLQQGLITPGQAADIVRHKVLQFDPSIGSHGAFVVQEPPSVPPVGSSMAGTNTAAAAAAAQQAGGLQLAPLTVRLQQDAGGVGGSSSSSAVPGLLDASPWESPTGKQLMDLAAAFGNLAAASTPSRTAASSTGNSPAAAAVSLGMPAAGLPPAVAAAAAGGAAGVLGVGVPCEYGVEEVPVETLNAAELPVLVQNEKSCSSLHAPSPAGEAAASGGRPLPVMLGASVPQHQQQQQQRHRDSRQQQPAWGASWQQQQHPGPVQQAQGHGSAPWQQQWVPHQQQVEHSGCMEQQYQHVMQQQHQRTHGSSFTGGLESGLPPAAEAQVWQLQWQQETHDMRPAQQARQAHQLPHEAYHQPMHVQQQQACAGGQHEWPPQPWPAQPPMPGQRQQQQQWQQQQQQQPWQQVAAQSPPLSRDAYNQPQQQCLVLADADAAVDATDHVDDMQLHLAAGDARQLLERFDESLVDLLVEVERLEQQQQARRRQQQQQHWDSRQQQNRQQQELPPPLQLGSYCSGQRHSYAPQEQLLQQHSDQWKGQQQHQQQWHHQEPQQPRAVPQQVQDEPGHHAQYWQPGAAALHAQPGDDEVSDILNL